VNSKCGAQLQDELIVEKRPLQVGPAYAKSRSLPSRLQVKHAEAPEPVKPVAVENAYFREIPGSLLNAFNISI
jgi:hypothetical protein